MKHAMFLLIVVLGPNVDLARAKNRTVDFAGCVWTLPVEMEEKSSEGGRAFIVPNTFPKPAKGIDFYLRSERISPRNTGDGQLKVAPTLISDRHLHMRWSIDIDNKPGGYSVVSTLVQEIGTLETVHFLNVELSEIESSCDWRPESGVAAPRV